MVGNTIRTRIRDLIKKRRLVQSMALALADGFNTKVRGIERLLMIIASVINSRLCKNGTTSRENMLSQSFNLFYNRKAKQTLGQEHINVEDRPAA